jgi:hypothetical protein
MNEFRYTRHQVARGALPDAEHGDVLFLVKACSALRLTYQIRLLTFRATQGQLKLVIKVNSNCTIHPSLIKFQRDNRRGLRIEKIERQGKS